MFQAVSCHHLVPIAPADLGDVSAGISVHLQRWLLHWFPELGGIPLAYMRWSVISGDQSSAAILDDNPCIHVAVRVDWVLFVPEVGSKVTGVVSITGPEHVGVLVLGKFSATVRAASMAAFARYDPDIEAWVQRGTGTVLSSGATVDFVILAVAVNQGEVSFDGSIDSTL